MTHLSLRINIKCEKCKELQKATLYQIANEELVLCPCGAEIQIFDFGGAVKELLEDLYPEEELSA